MQYECTECGQLTRVGHAEGAVERECPVCDALTRWEPAFEGEGVSF
ncbi:hypothetical protein HUG10_09490 [Halorarum halophilum]|uniref:Rubrerythrin-like domain-containing protein n=1 Tax=Halorarum halophilum TaxID=2743090 RepID=A0A7D5GBU2_9EURY|nr:hypothetical protein [Halobaculum halophilum]QLG27772.1 hypothetical protein HUG10_09490 [Halobaculum halophilum]